MTKIEWTDATWNPIVGCSLVSPACTNCYAMAQAARIERMSPGLEHYRGLTQIVNGKPVWTGKVALAPEAKLLEPLRWKKPRRIFVNSMSDLFHESVPDDWLDKIFAVMALAPQHTFQVLTKRPKRMRAYCSDPATPARVGARVLDIHRRGGVSVDDVLGALANRAKEEDPEFVRMPLPNVWLGVTAEDQPRADERIPELLATPAAVRFVSVEPMLGPVDLARCEVFPNSYDDRGRIKRSGIRIDALRGKSVESGLDYHSDWDGEGSPPTTPPPHLDWIICGGESGPGARPMHPGCARSLRDQCAAAGVPFFFKQWGRFEIAEELGDREKGDNYWRFPSDGDEFHIVSDGHDIIMCGAEDAKEPKKLWKQYWADGHGHLAKPATNRLLDGREHNEFPEPRA